MATIHEYKFKAYGKNPGLYHHEIEVVKETPKTYKIDTKKSYSFYNTLKKSEAGIIGYDNYVFCDERIDEEVKQMFIDERNRKIKNYMSTIDLLKKDVELLSADVIEGDIDKWMV